MHVMQWDVFKVLCNGLFGYVFMPSELVLVPVPLQTLAESDRLLYKGWNFNSGNYLFTTDTK